jgi:hypothetical protein
MRARVEALQWTVAKDLLTAGAPVVLQWGTWDAPNATRFEYKRVRWARPLR